MTQSPPALKLSDLSMRLDIRSFYESHKAIVSGKPTNSPRDGREYASSCPRCGGTDRFSFWDSGRFCCIRGNCNNWHGSSPYYFLRDEGYSHAQALEELGIEPDEIASDSYSHTTPPALPLWLVQDDPPNKKWQEAAMIFCHAAEKYLWSPMGESVRAYLQSRGLTESTIRSAHLGFVPELGKQSLEQWGISPEQVNKTDERVWLPKGITLPWYVDGNIHKIQVRRPKPESEKYGKYAEILGSSDCLYNVDTIKPNEPVMLVESELDALSVHQEASDLIACVATGGSGKALSGRPIARLNHASFILQAFDDDEAGNAGAEKWLDIFDENSERWTPWAHDCNDMLKNEPGSIRRWVNQALNMIAVQGEIEEFEPEPVVPPALFDLAGKEIPAHLIATIPNLIERVRLFQEGSLTRKKVCCDTLDWMIDPTDGLLICPCVEHVREEGRRINLKNNIW